MKHATSILKGFALLLLVFGFVGCDTLEDLNPFNDEKEVQGIVEAIGNNSLTVDGIVYTVTAETEYEGFTGLSDIAVGDEVEIEYTEDENGRTAVEVEDPANEDDDSAAL